MSSRGFKILFTLLSIPFAYCNYWLATIVIRPYDLHIQQEWRSTVLTEKMDSFSLVYITTKLDTILGRLVSLNVEAIKHPIGLLWTCSLLGMITTIYVLISIEAARNRASYAERLAAPVALMVGNLVGISVVIPLVWLPINVWTQMRLKYRQYSFNNYVHPFLVIIILLAAIFGHILVVSLPFMAKNVEQLDVLLKTCQFAPLLYYMTESACSMTIRIIWPGYDSLHPVTRADAIQSKIAIQQLFISLAVVNLILYYGILIFSFIHDVNVFRSTAEIVWRSLSIGNQEPGSKSLVCTLYVIINLVGLIISFAYWAFLDDGLDGVILFAIACLVLGPGAGLATYCWVREQSMHKLPNSKGRILQFCLIFGNEQKKLIY
jgi:hypothetical protein